MKTEQDKQVKNILSILVSILICEVMLNLNNIFFQLIGVCILPIIIVYGVFLFKNEMGNI